MKRKPTQSDTEKKSRRRLRLQKIPFYALLAVACITALVLSSIVFVHSYQNRLAPQVNRAVIQVADLLPQLEKNQAMLTSAYEQMKVSWEKLFYTDSEDYSEYIDAQDAEYFRLVDDTLSWMNRVTRLKIGRDGYMYVVSKETSRIIAHPNADYVGHRIMPLDRYAEDKLISIHDIRPSTLPEKLPLQLGIVEPYSLLRRNFKSDALMDDYIGTTLYGCVIDNDETYIVCGVPMMEIASYVLENTLVFNLFFLILMWLFVKWIWLERESGTHTARKLLPKLVSYAAMVCVALFGVSLYIQMLTNTTNDLKTMGKHADDAVEMVNSCQDERDKINAWLDHFYETQCTIAGMNLSVIDRERLSREDMQEYADLLNVRHMYLFDEQGQVVATNSPYDHFTLSTDPKNPSYKFRKLLEGVELIKQSPAYDERYEEYVQYVGVSLRDEADLCDGFVLIAVDPTLRDGLLSLLTVDSVLSNLTVGLPEYAVAIDKATLNIAATTGIGFKDAPIDSLGLRPEDITENLGGYLKIDGTLYYAGMGESAQLYMVLLVRPSGEQKSFVVALQFAAYGAITALLIILLTLFSDRRNAPEGAPAEDEAALSAEADAHLEGEEASWHLFNGISSFIHRQEKRGMEERWKTTHVPRDQQTPRQRIRRIIYWLLLLFCLFILLPTIYINLDHSGRGLELNSLAYIVSGKWQKGINIFSLTSCIILLCAMYVTVVLINRILFAIAQVSDMRVETVCLLLKNSLKYICVVVFVYYGLSRFGADTQTLLASAGILSLMISLGAKDLVSDIIAGFFTLIEGSYKVGDFITVGSWYGTVVEIGLRTTKVRFFAETKVFNNSSMRDIINLDGAVSRMSLNIPISYSADLVKVEEALSEELPKLTDVIPGLLKPPIYEGVDSFADSSVMLKIAIYVKTESRFPALRRLNREVKLIFDRRGIEIPFNQIVVHEAKDGDAR